MIIISNANRINKQELKIKYIYANNITWNLCREEWRESKWMKWYDILFAKIVNDKFIIYIDKLKAIYG